MLVKVVEKLKTGSQGFMLKAAADPKNAHAYVIEAKSIMGTQKLKRQEMESKVLKRNEKTFDSLFN